MPGRFTGYPRPSSYRKGTWLMMTTLVICDTVLSPFAHSVEGRGYNKRSLLPCLWLKQVWTPGLTNQPWIRCKSLEKWFITHLSRELWQQIIVKQTIWALMAIPRLAWRAIGVLTAFRAEHWRQTCHDWHDEVHKRRGIRPRRMEGNQQNRVISRRKNIENWT